MYTFLLVLLLPLSFFAWKLIPSSNIAHLPSVSVYKYLISFIKGMSSDDRNELLIMPMLYKFKVIRFWINRWIVSVSDLELSKKIFTQTEHYEKETVRSNVTYSFGKQLFGNNIVFTSGEEWKRHRKIVNPAFHRSWSSDIIGDCAKGFIDQIQLEKGDVDILPLLKRMTLDALGKSIFDFDFKAITEPNGKYVTLYTSVAQELRKTIYVFFPILEHPIFSLRTEALKKAIEFRKLISQVLDQKKEKIEKGEAIHDEKADLLTLMIKANRDITEDGKPLLSKEEMIDDAVIFFVAGHDTTANTLAFIMYYLSKHQDIQQKAREEVIRVMGKRTGPPSLEEQKEMHYLLAIIYEAMRLKPTVGQLFRVTNNEIELESGFILKPNQVVSINLYAMLHDPNYWKEPNEFNPDRFIKETLVDNQPSYEFDKSATKAWFAFGGGPRSCIGLSFSLMEQKILLAMLLIKYKFSLPQNSPHRDKVILSSGGLTYPKELKVTFEEV
ncbi:cytochrome P450 [Neoconidiobolus thromboides FSU 785]|nr:cytochrome P450 [Neoconidiobolus thromboides FSU 785]